MIQADEKTTVSLEWKGTGAILHVQGATVGNAVRLTLAQLDELLSDGAQAARTGRALQRPDYYAVLGVPRTATTAEIKKAYRHLVKQHHPDVQTGDDTHVKTINAAYAVVSDPDKRREYDQCR